MTSLQKGKRETEEDRERESFTLINADKSTDETQPKKQNFLEQEKPGSLKRKTWSDSALPKTEVPSEASWNLKRRKIRLRAS
jgi:hypothetical protein